MSGPAEREGVPERSATEDESVSFTVGPDERGERLDRVVVRHVPALGRRAAASLFAEGRVFVRGRVARKGDPATDGDVVTLSVTSTAPIDPEPGDLVVVLERPDLVVVDKPAGMPTAPLRLGEAGSLAGRLLARYPEMRRIGHRPREPGLVHRLDTETSGLVVAARTAAAFEHLTRALSEGRLEKRYLAVVAGEDFPAEVTATHPLGPDARNRARVRVFSPGSPEGRPSTTRLSRVRSAAGRTLVEASASPAYRHQVRAHLAALGWPILGDPTYGGTRAPELAPGRHALHASYVAWAGDDVVRGFSARAELPPDLGALFPG
ncbi:MAG TPA: RluA family pseudouridine synthase [Polyangiaceae bacterium]|nr:RluA family pseudouridine synthase [Polyangiaceae bacterium]